MIYLPNLGVESDLNLNVKSQTDYFFCEIPAQTAMHQAQLIESPRGFLVAI